MDSQDRRDDAGAGPPGQQPPPEPAPPQPPAWQQQQQAPQPYQPPPPGPYTPGVAPAPHATWVAQPGTLQVAGVTWVPAGFVPRLIAFGIDWALLSIITMLVFILIEVPEPSEADAMKLAQTIVSNPMAALTPGSNVMRQVEELERPLRFKGWMNIAICACYFIIFNGLLGASVGKLILGLRILRNDGRPIGVGGAFARYLGYLLSSRLIYTIWWMNFNPEKRTLYDQLLKMNVYRPLEQAQHSPPWQR